jgi:hypothetical protein
VTATDLESRLDVGGVARYYNANRQLTEYRSVVSVEAAIASREADLTLDGDGQL